MPNPVAVPDLEARFRSLTDDEQPVAQALFDDAWAILLSQKPSLDAQLEAGTVASEIVRFVVTAMVLRVLRNPNGVRQWSVGDYSETRDGSISAGSLYLAPEELGLLSPAGMGSGAAFTITPSNDGPGFRSDVLDDLLDWS